MSARTINTWHSYRSTDDHKAQNVKQRVVLRDYDGTDVVEIAYEINEHDIDDHHEPSFVEETVLRITPSIGVRTTDGTQLGDGDTIVFDSWTDAPYGNPDKTVDHRIRFRVGQTNKPDGIVIYVEQQRADPVREHEFGSWDTGEFHTIDSTEVIVGELPESDARPDQTSPTDTVGTSTTPHETTTAGNASTPLEDKFPESLK